MNKVCTVALMRHGGSHLIRPIVANLGFDIVEPGNFHTPLDQAVGPVVVFLRDPRNRMAATLRWWRIKPRKNDLLGSFEGLPDHEVADRQLLYLLDKQGFLEEMTRWANVWCKWPPPKIVLRFESMSVPWVRALASHLGLPDDRDRDERVFSETYGKGRTYTGSHSRWEDYFGPLSMRYWENNGGGELVDLMGYKQ